MKQFNDMKGKTWDVAMSVGALKRVRDLVGVDLMELPRFDQAKPEDGLLYRLGIDPVLLVNVLYCMVKPQADDAGVTDEQFAELLGGDALTDATNAFLEEAIGFFPQGVRDALNQVLRKARTVEGMMLDQLAKAVNNPELDKAIQEAAGLQSGGAVES